jgi:hypothetical protein
MPMSVPEPTAVLPDRAGWLDLLDRYGAAVTGGLVAGFLVGGVGGRLAMFVLRVTSDDTVRGLESDDGFEIGRVSSDSVFLLVATTLVGTLLAFGYLVVRRWLPEARRPLQSATFFGLVGGAAIIHPDGVDFTVLDPRALAIGLFVALPAAYGWLMAALIEDLIAHPGKARKARVAAIILFAVVGFFGLFPVIAAVLGLLLVLLGRRWPALASAVDGPLPTWAVRVGLVAGAALSFVALVRDSAEIL